MSTTLVKKSTEDSQESKSYGMLLATDRCDRCGAQAYVRAVHPTATAWHGVLNQDLLFCGHDFEHASKSGKLSDWSVLDERAKLNS